MLQAGGTQVRVIHLRELGRAPADFLRPLRAEVANAEPETRTRPQKEGDVAVPLRARMRPLPAPRPAACLSPDWGRRRRGLRSPGRSSARLITTTVPSRARYAIFLFPQLSSRIQNAHQFHATADSSRKSRSRSARIACSGSHVRKATQSPGASWPASGRSAEITVPIFG